MLFTFSFFDFSFFQFSFFQIMHFSNSLFRFFKSCIFPIHFFIFSFFRISFFQLRIKTYMGFHFEIILSYEIIITSLITSLLFVKP